MENWYWRAGERVLAIRPNEALETELVGAEYRKWSEDDFRKANAKRRELGITFDTTAGLATLVEALKFAHSAKVSLRLKLHERPLYLFQVTGLLPLFDPSPDTTVHGASQGDA